MFCWISWRIFRRAKNEDFHKQKFTEQRELKEGERDLLGFDFLSKIDNFFFFFLINKFLIDLMWKENRGRVLFYITESHWGLGWRRRTLATCAEVCLYVGSRWDFDAWTLWVNVSVCWNRWRVRGFLKLRLQFLNHDVIKGKWWFCFCEKCQI